LAEMFGPHLGPSLIDVLKWYVGKARSAADYSDTYDRFGKSGIAGGGITGYHPYSTDAGRLASIASSKNYPTDPMMQAKFVALMKQLGYLPHQAY
jgi:hypothetical protein